jgi:hypothetical protein
MLMANHLTNVISWDGFKGQDGIRKSLCVGFLNAWFPVW